MLYIYPDAPAPVDDSVNINIACVDNAHVVGSPQVSCFSDGTWGSEGPMCQCNLGYEDMGTECIGMFQFLYYVNNHIILYVLTKTMFTVNLCLNVSFVQVVFSVQLEVSV